MKKYLLKLMRSIFLLLLIGGITFSFNQLYAQATTDIAYLVNGSGSIDANDFNIQKEGIKIALNNAAIFPKDGTIGFALVQYADGRTEVHVPYTIINNTTIGTIISQIDAFQQISGLTNPGDGINVATNLLTNNGDANAKKIICLSTDGLPNSGANVSTAVANAQSAGIAQFSVIAIEDLPNVAAADFEKFYRPLVFGNGDVTVARNFTEFAALVGSTCLFADVELIALEAVQTIQSWEDDVPLIQDKATYVRAFLQPKDNMTPTPVSARLKVTGNGMEEILTATNKDKNNFMAMPNIATMRADFKASLNFEIPQKFLNGTIELEVIGAGIEGKEKADIDNDRKVEVTFEQVDNIDLKFVKVAWTDAMGNTQKLGNNDVIELVQRLNSLYPLPELGIDFSIGSLDMTMVSPPTNLITTNINAQLATQRILDNCTSGCNTIYYGAVAPGLNGISLPNGQLGEASGIPSSTSSGSLPNQPFTYGRNNHAHEVGHNLGLEHVTRCGAPSNNPPSFPYSANIGGVTVAPIGPLNSGQDKEIWGWDSKEKRVIDPRQHFELISYCGNGPNNPFVSDVWISDFTYNNLKVFINNTFRNPNTQVSGVNIDYLLIRGIIDLNIDQVEFLPFVSFTAPNSLPAPSGNEYVLVLSDDQGSIIAQIPFTPSFGTEGDEEAFFNVLVEANPNIKKVEVLKNGQEIGEISASANAPTVEVVFPNGGENLNEDEVTFEWTASDTDGDALTFLIQYSRDNGTTWETLLTNGTALSYTIALEELGETYQGLIRVIASDGFNSSMDESNGTFVTPNNAPVPLILSPSLDELFTDVQPIAFRAFATDIEDGLLSGSSIEWSSDLDGILGTGEVLDLLATDLSEGIHIITLKITDSSGGMAAATTSIIISRLPVTETIDATIPTLSQWGLLIFGLLMAILGTVFIYNQKYMALG